LERRELGESSIEVPVVGVGTWQVLDVRGPEEEARHELVRAALEEGANLFDSSPMYGEAERVLGEALEKYGRERAIVATKVWTSNDGEAERQIERSLGYFGGRVDLYQVHNLVALEKSLDALHRLKDEGRARAVRVTHYSRGFRGLDKRHAERPGGLRAGSLQRRRDRRDGEGATARAGAGSRRDLGIAPITQTHPNCTSAWCCAIAPGRYVLSKH
jgi:aryl-alcohol dehydrogenase-like predicted oxidoreductase